MSKDYSLLDGTPYGFELTGIPNVKKDQVFLWEGEEGLFKAKSDALLKEGSWFIEVEDENFKTRYIIFKKGDLAFAPKLYTEIIKK